MGELNKREHELVAIGAAIASNCVPCIAFHVGKAREIGFNDGQIEEAITLAQEIRNPKAINLIVLGFALAKAGKFKVSQGKLFCNMTDIKSVLKNR